VRKAFDSVGIVGGEEVLESLKLFAIVHLKQYHLDKVENGEKTLS
jgi:hypothetical protein